MSAVLASEVTFNEAILRLAAVHEREVEFFYKKGGDSTPSTRAFTPESVSVAPDGSVSFTGPDPDRDYAPRCYRLDRIVGDVEFT